MEGSDSFGINMQLEVSWDEKRRYPELHSRRYHSGSRRIRCDQADQMAVRITGSRNFNTAGNAVCLCSDHHYRIAGNDPDQSQQEKIITGWKLKTDDNLSFTMKERTG